VAAAIRNTKLDIEWRRKNSWNFPVS